MFFTSVLMVGQYFLERRYARGTRLVDVGEAGNPLITQPRHDGDHA